MLNDEFRTHRLSGVRPTRTDNNAGGRPITDTPLGQLEGSLQPLYSVEMIVAAAERAEARWQLYLDPDQDVQRDDVRTVTHILMAGRWVVPQIARTFRVVSVGEWIDGGDLAHMVVQLEELQRGK